MKLGSALFRRLLLLTGVFGALVLFAAACGGETATPTPEPVPTATSAPAQPAVAPIATATSAPQQAQATATPLATVPTPEPTREPAPAATAVPAQAQATATPLPDSPTQEELIERLRRAESAFFYDIGNYGGRITYATISEPLTFNYPLAADSGSATYLSYLYEGLTEASWLTNEIEPALAESWEVSADGLTWTVQFAAGR